jgi:regulator of protease activity HflC (stomatin/prohibitin superfamily)
MNIPGVLLLVVLTSLLIAGGLSQSRFRLAEHERLAVFRLGHLVDMRGPGVVWILPYLDSGVKLDAEDAFEARRIADYRDQLSKPADRR